MWRFTHIWYHRVLKAMKNDSVMIRKDKMSEAVSNNSSRNLFDEVKQMNVSKRSITMSVEEMAGDDVSNVFVINEKLFRAVFSI